MTEEEAFLQQIYDNPNDDTARLVYADWLEERGDIRAEYLRLACQVRAIPLRLAKLRETIDPDWTVAVSHCRKVMLVSYAPLNKISVIKKIRELTGLGLADAKILSESKLPIAMKDELTPEEAQKIADQFKDLATVSIVGCVKEGPGLSC